MIHLSTAEAVLRQKTQNASKMNSIHLSTAEAVLRHLIRESELP